MEFDFSGLPPATCYKLLVAAVVPRPIALVSTLGAAGFRAFPVTLPAG